MYFFLIKKISPLNNQTQDIDTKVNISFVSQNDVN
jgi:hypothetical protein